MLQINGKEWKNLTEEDIIMAINTVEESFFYEFKEDEETNKKMIEEIDAFANTYGGYIFIGISDNKEIKGCKSWNEERIVNVIHDSISPIPSFDIKKFVLENNKVILVIRIDEGSDLPYITNKGLIYERISSETCIIRDSIRLSHMLEKRRDQIERIEKKISINSILSEVENLYGYIDLGFVLGLRSKEVICEKFWDLELSTVGIHFQEDNTLRTISRIGESIIITCSDSEYGGTDIKKALPAGVNCFMEVMMDGSVRLRLLLLKDNNDEKKVSLAEALTLCDRFMTVYGFIFGDFLEENLIHFKKYEKLSVIKQFQPVLVGNNTKFKNSEGDTILSEYDRVMREYVKISGPDIVITDDRIPKTGLYCIDRIWFDKNKVEFNKKNILNELFCSSFLLMGSEAFRNMDLVPK